MPAIVLIAIALLILGGAVAASIIFDTKRVLATSNRSGWLLAAYRRELPGLLAVLSGSGVVTPWPARVSGYSIVLFRMKLRRLRLAQQGFAPDLPARHIAFWLHVNDRLSLLDFAISSEIITAARRLSESRTSCDTIGYPQLAERHQSRIEKLFPILKQELGPELYSHARACFAEFRRIEVIFNEHGFHLHPDFERLRELEADLESAHSPNR